VKSPFVAEHEQLLGVLGLAPGVHDEGVIDRHAGDGIHPHGLDLVGVHHVAGQVGQAASGGECPGNREQQDLLASKDVLGGDICRAFFAHGLEGTGGDLVPGFDSHDTLLGMFPGWTRNNSRWRV